MRIRNWERNDNDSRGFRKSPPALLGRPLVFLVLLLMLAAYGDAWWTPGPGVSWQWQLSGELDLSLDVDMYNIDLFDTSADDIGVLRERGIVVICSFSAGSLEEDSEDADAFDSSWLGWDVAGGATGERWLNITEPGVLSAMGERMDLAVNKSCDGVEPSNVQMFAEGSGFNVSYGDQIVYNSWLAGQAHDRNLSAGLRNDWSQLDDLEEYFDWALSEDCLSNAECDAYDPNFVEAGKAVLDAEYLQFDLAFCDNVTASGLDVIVKDTSLDSARCSCQNPSTHIDCDSLLDQSATTSTGGSSSWVIATAVCGSVFIILCAAVVSVWRRRKVGASGNGGLGGGGGGMEGCSSRDGFAMR